MFCSINDNEYIFDVVGISICGNAGRLKGKSEKKKTLFVVNFSLNKPSMSPCD